MPSYTSEARKAQYLTYCKMGLKNAHGATKAGISRDTGHNIWTQAGQLEIDHSEKDLPPVEELVAVKPKAGRSKVLNELECNTIFAACRSGMEGRVG
jgi:hypothetical protein